MDRYIPKGDTPHHNGSSPDMASPAGMMGPDRPLVRPQTEVPFSIDGPKSAVADSAALSGLARVARAEGPNTPEPVPPTSDLVRVTREPLPSVPGTPPADQVRTPSKPGDLVIVDEIPRRGLVAQRISDDMNWGVGLIRPPAEYKGEEPQRALIGSVMDNIEEVPPEEAGMSGCTDGRRPLRLLNGESVPVRKQTVGANLVSGLYVADSLGERFFPDPNAPAEERIDKVAELLYENGKFPSGHPNCGAGANFAGVSANVPRFAENDLYVARNQLFLPDGVYDQTLHDDMMTGNRQRADQDFYADLHPDMFVGTIERFSGPRALAELRDDGRGVHGHVEEGIVRLRVGNCALNEVGLAAATGDREVFAVNDDEMDEIAALFSRGNEDNYRIARMAIEDFANAGHGTLAQGLPTWRITTLA